MVTGLGIAANSAQKVVTTQGSVNNKVNCAADHLKNDVKTFAPLALVGAATGLVAYKKPDYIKNLAKATGNVIGKVGKFFTEKVIKKGFGTGLLNKVLNNPTKAGAAGLITGAALWTINKLCKHSYNAGQIDQKYTDAAKLENTKNIIFA